MKPVILLVLGDLLHSAALADPPSLPRDDGYRSVWYMNQPSKNRCVFAVYLDRPAVSCQHS